ncbi:MAG: hypothetical protein L3J38_06060, partial [Thiomicrorhabdus sp.]|nr:hypothetical protein [Thiomicrorhabdus sp.]
MTDFKAVHERAELEQQEEPVLTRLVSSEGLSASSIEAWQLNQFECFDLNEAEKVPDIPEEIYQQVKKKIEPELKQQAELLKKEAYDLAYQKGYQEGFAEGAEKGKTEAKALALQASNEALSVKLAEMDALVAMLKQPYDQLEESVLTELTELALHVAERVLQKDVSGDKEWVLKTVQEAILVLPEDDVNAFSVELSADDLALLQSLDHPVVATWNLKVNSALEQGVCVVKQGNSSVLNSWKARF